MTVPRSIGAALVRTAKSNLDAVLLYRTQAPTLPLGKRWSKYARWAQQNIGALSEPIDIIRFAQTQFSFEIRESGEELRYAVAAYEWKILAEFPDAAGHLTAFFEPESSDPNSVVLHNGRSMASHLCHLLRFHLVMATYAPSAIDTICEIGGGYGAPARVWFISPIRRPKRYIIIDIAESLFFAETFLRYELPDLKITHLMTAEISDAEVILCPLELLDRLPRAIDLVVNTISLSEMPEPWVDFYMSWLDQSDASYFFSFNTFGRSIANMHENMNVWSPRPSANWVARLLRFPYDSDFAEMLFARLPPTEALRVAHRALFKAMRHRALDRTTFLNAIDALRYLRDKQLAADFIGRCLSELRTIPKELSYLVDMVGHHPARQRIESARRSGREGVVSAFVRL